MHVPATNTLKTKSPYQLLQIGFKNNTIVFQLSIAAFSFSDLARIDILLPKSLISGINGTPIIKNALYIFCHKK